MTHQVIPEAAVEAAARADYGEGWEVAADWKRADYRYHATKLLEATAPHLLAGAGDEGEEAWSDN